MPDAAHIHPALVHFPIVLIVAALCLDLAVWLRGQSLTSQGCPARVATAAWILGAAFAIPTAVVGDMAFDQAVTSGYPQDALLLHHNLGVATTLLLVAVAAMRGYAWREGHVLSGRRGWMAWGAGLLGVTVLIATSYYGGHLVYELGVNIAPQRP